MVSSKKGLDLSTIPEGVERSTSVGDSNNSTPIRGSFQRSDIVRDNRQRGSRSLSVESDDIIDSMLEPDVSDNDENSNGKRPPPQSKEPPGAARRELYKQRGEQDSSGEIESDSLTNLRFNPSLQGSRTLSVADNDLSDDKSDDSEEDDSSDSSECCEEVDGDLVCKEVVSFSAMMKENIRNWSQQREAYSEYYAILAEHDSELPSASEYRSFATEESLDSTKAFEQVRQMMVENGHTDGEVTAFFEGLTIQQVKINSLRSQIRSHKKLKQISSKWQNLASKALNGRRPMPRARSASAVVLTEHSMQNEYSDHSQQTKEESIDKVMVSCRVLSVQKLLKKASGTGNAEMEKLLKDLQEAEKKQKKLEKQLEQAGIVIAEDIPYAVAKSKVEEISKRMQEIGSSQVEHPDKEIQAALREEYFKLEQDMEKYSTALTLTDEYIAEQEKMERDWEDRIRKDNEEAMKKIRRHMPVDVKNRSEGALATETTPNGKVLPRVLAKRFKRTNVLQILRTNPNDLEKVHPSTLENLRVTGLTLTERRAIHLHLDGVAQKWKAQNKEKNAERKWTWFKTMRLNFKSVEGQYWRHIQQYGPPGNHPYATRQNPDVGCPLIGKQCPLKADANPSYDNDYGYTEDAEYEVSTVQKADVDDQGAKAKQEAMEFARAKASNARSDKLKKHYKGKVIEVAKANGSCENMDELMDNMEMKQTKWIETRLTDGDVPNSEGVKKFLIEFREAINEVKLAVLQFAGRSGMQISGKRDAKNDKADIRSSVEIGLCEEVCESSKDFFDGIEEHLKKMGKEDKRITLDIKLLTEMLNDLHDRNVATLKVMGIERPEPSRKWKTRAELTVEVQVKLGPSPEEIAALEAEEEEYYPPARPPNPFAGGGGGRGDLMSAIAGRGRGGPGRGDLMSAIAARGRGGGQRGGGGGDPGRGDLMAAIAARGRGREGNPGRGDLNAAITARGRGDSQRNASPRGSGRGDLMAAIAARGRGRG